MAAPVVSIPGALEATYIRIERSQQLLQYAGWFCSAGNCASLCATMRQGPPEAAALPAFLRAEAAQQPQAQATCAAPPPPAVCVDAAVQATELRQAAVQTESPPAPAAPDQPVQHLPQAPMLLCVGEPQPQLRDAGTSTSETAACSPVWLPSSPTKRQRGMLVGFPGRWRQATCVTLSAVVPWACKGGPGTHSRRSLVLHGLDLHWHGAHCQRQLRLGCRHGAACVSGQPPRRSWLLQITREAAAAAGVPSEDPGRAGLSAAPPPRAHGARSVSLAALRSACNASSTVTHCHPSHQH